MTIDREMLWPADLDSKSSTRKRRTQKMAAGALASLVCCAIAGPTGCANAPLQNASIGPSGAQITAAAIGVGTVVVGTVVLIEVHHSHHTVKGCVFSDQNGLRVQTEGNAKTYALAGVNANIKVGDLVRFHGTKVKKVKGSTGNQTFTVDRISKDYGPCKLSSGYPVNAPSGR